LNYLNNNKFDISDNYDKAIDKEVRKLKEPQFSIFYNKKKQTILSYVDYYKMLEDEEKQIIFDISNIINDFNTVENWTFGKIKDFIKFKNEQIKQQKNGSK